MPGVGIGRPSDLISAHSSNQLSDHRLDSAIFNSMATVLTSAIGHGNPVGALSPTSIAASSASIATASSSKPMSGPRPEVICPLPNADGSSCRKKCSGTFAYRSICEHIRRAHPEHWIPRLPASAESFHKMIQTPPTPKDTTIYNGAGSAGAGSGTASGGSSRKSSSGAISKPRSKGLRPKPATQDDSYPEDNSVSGSNPESSEDAHERAAMRKSPESYEYEGSQSNVVSETDTESDHTHSPSSTPTVPSGTSSRPVTASKSTTAAKGKSSGSRKKSLTSTGSKTKSSPRKAISKRRVDRKPSNTALESLYATQAASVHDARRMSGAGDLMDLDLEFSHRQHYVLGNGQPHGSKNDNREDDLENDEVGLILNGMSRLGPGDGYAHPNYQIRRAFSFSVGDGNGYPPSSFAASRPRGGLMVDTGIGNMSHEYDQDTSYNGTMSAGGAFAKDGCSRWNELIEAADKAREEGRSESDNGDRTPLLYQSAASRNGTMHQGDVSPFGPNLPPSLMMMMDIATAEAAELNRRRNIEQHHMLQQHQPQPQHFGSQYYGPPSGYFGPRYHSHPHPQAGFGPEHLHYNTQQTTVNHTNISPILHGTSLSSRAPSTFSLTNPPSTATTPYFSKPPSPRVESPRVTPKIQCSLCHAQVDISASYACTECIYGFCQGCVSAYEGGPREDMEGKVKREPAAAALDTSEKPAKKPNASRKDSGGVVKRKLHENRCGVCGVQGARFKPVKLVINV